MPGVPRVPSEMFRFTHGERSELYSAILHTFAEANERMETALLDHGVYDVERRGGADVDQPPDLGVLELDPQREHRGFVTRRVPLGGWRDGPAVVGQPAGLQRGEQIDDVVMLLGHVSSVERPGAQQSAPWTRR